MNFAKSNTRPDDGSWLSAQQAVLPDGTEVGNLPLVNKKLPQLYPPSNPQPAEPQSKLQAAIEAMEFLLNTLKATRTNAELLLTALR